LDPDLAAKLAEQRAAWQTLGYLSPRRFPAQMVFTRSGANYSESDYFLSARIFQETHPDGSPIEVYVITSQKGAEEVFTFVYFCFVFKFFLNF
jgi:hypothetical protein